MKEINLVIEDLEMLREGSWVPDEDSCNASIDILETAKVKFSEMHSDEEVKFILDQLLIEHSNIVLADIPHWFDKFKKT